MIALPVIGTRVSLRYRRPPGSVPPLTDVVGHLLQTEPHVLVRTKAGAVVEVPADDIVTVRALTDVPVPTRRIRAMEHAAALAWPGTEQEWINGWLVRGADGHTHRANSAVPLEMEANVAGVPAVVEWYLRRGQIGRASCRERV